MTTIHKNVYQCRSLLTLDLSCTKRDQIPRGETLFLQNLKKHLHLQGFDHSRHMIDMELRWIYGGSLPLLRYDRNNLISMDASHHRIVTSMPKTIETKC